MAIRFHRYLGIDYSGAGLPSVPARGIRVFETRGSGAAQEIRAGVVGKRAWSREQLRAFLEEALTAGEPTLVGIDHAFSLPKAKLDAAGVRSWDDVLDLFLERVQTQERTVEAARHHPACRGLLEAASNAPFGERFRLIDRRTPGAKSVYHYVGPGVAHSTMAGIAQLALLRRELAEAGAPVAFWPFDSLPEGSAFSLVVEAYPALCNRQYERLAGHTGDQHDARCVALWLRDCDRDGRLGVYLNPPWTERELAEVRVEGWILGVM